MRLNRHPILAVALAAALVPPLTAFAPKQQVSDPVVVAEVVEPAPPAPSALQARLEALAAQYREPVGIAVSDVESGWVAAVNGEMLFPQQSVSKLWVALTAMQAVERGDLGLDAPVLMGPMDRSVFYQPVARRIGQSGYTTFVGDLLNRALIESDNAANDMLLKLTGGVGAVTAVLAQEGLDGIHLGADEKNLQSMISGMTWRPEYGHGNKFKEARAQLPDQVRDAAMAAYLANPADGASPVGIANALAALHRGELLSDAGQAVILNAMAKAETGPRRLKGGLPPGWTIAHKTGTGQDWRGYSVGINDVGLITAPDGRTYAVAVLIKRTSKPVGARMAFMQQVSKAVVDNWAAESRPTTAAADPAPAG